MSGDRADQTRVRWLQTLERYRRDPAAPGSADYWSPSLDCASRDELRAIQDAKLAALTPFLYENSPFYRRRFDRLGLAPTDLRTVDDLPKWPVVDKTEMMQDAAAHPPFGTYTTHDDALWAARGWMMFSSSGSSGVPRVFRYSQLDRELWAWANARALHAFGVRPGDTMLVCAGYGPHVFAWGVQFAIATMGVACIPGGGLTGEARALLVDRFRPSIVTCTPSYALHLGRVMMYPVQLEAAVRAVPGVGDEYEIVLATNADGLDMMTARVEHPDAAIAARVAREVQVRCEVRCEVEVLSPGTLPKTEFKARRIRDTRRAG